MGQYSKTIEQLVEGAKLVSTSDHLTWRWFEGCLEKALLAAERVGNQTAVKP
jgi:hypothetical protein